MTEVSQEPRATRAGDQVDRPGLLTGSLIEALGSFFIVLTGLGVTVFNPQAGLAPGLAFGLALLAAIAAFGRLSGGYFNPALTLGLAMAGRTQWKAVLPFIAAQVVGALAASGLFWLILSAHPQQVQISGLFSVAANGYAENSATQFPLASVLLMEVAAAALLTAVVLGSTSRFANRAAAPFAIGLAYAVLITVLVPIDNGALNPARSTAAAVIAEPWAVQQLWLFWVAPLLGAVIAGLLHRSFELGRPVPRGEGHHDGAADADQGPAAAGAAVAAGAHGDQGQSGEGSGKDEGDARTSLARSAPAEDRQRGRHDDDAGASQR